MQELRRWLGSCGLHENSPPYPQNFLRRSSVQSFDGKARKALARKQRRRAMKAAPRAVDSSPQRCCEIKRDGYAYARLHVPLSWLDVVTWSPRLGGGEETPTTLRR